VAGEMYVFYSGQNYISKASRSLTPFSFLLVKTCVGTMEQEIIVMFHYQE
jgi:hypothetical protein